MDVGGRAMQEQLPRTVYGLFVGRPFVWFCLFWLRKINELVAPLRNLFKHTPLLLTPFSKLCEINLLSDQFLTCRDDLFALTA